MAGPRGINTVVSKRGIYALVKGKHTTVTFAGSKRLAFPSICLTSFPVPAWIVLCWLIPRRLKHSCDCKNLEFGEVFSNTRLEGRKGGGDRLEGRGGGWGRLEGRGGGGDRLEGRGGGGDRLEGKGDRLEGRGGGWGDRLEGRGGWGDRLEGRGGWGDRLERRGGGEDTLEGRGATQHQFITIAYSCPGNISSDSGVRNNGLAADNVTIHTMSHSGQQHTIHKGFPQVWTSSSFEIDI